MTSAPNITETKHSAAPFVEELLPAPDPVDAFARLATGRHCIFFDSARRDEELGRYSYLAVDPVETMRLDGPTDDPFGQLRERLGAYGCDTVEELPPFQGGAAGFFAYDLNRSFETIAKPRFDEFGCPHLHVGIYDVVLAFDHVEQRAWIISQGYPETDAARRAARAETRAAEFKRRLAQAAPPSSPPNASGTATLAETELAQQFAAGTLARLTSNVSRDDYLRTIERAIEYIHAGDIFQVNIAHRLLHPANDDAVSLYLRLRERNAAPFAGYYDLGDQQIVSASPERFLSCFEGEVEARPIKGTRPRQLGPEAEMYSARNLEQSEKDRAENVMIVDLLRNDLSRVCDAESIRVTQLCKLETYQYVQHLVSAVRGRLQNDLGPLDLLAAAFPGGSITGAPKIRAMEIITELEPTARGAYCGSLGYIGFNGAMDTSILIRTITAGRGWWQFPVGGGIVAQSDPHNEYEETWHKAEGLLRALR